MEGGTCKDADVGLQYLRARWYDVSVGRFTRKDPFSGVPTWPQSQNPYPYAANNPVLQMDPSGEICWPCAALLAVGLFYLATQTGCTAPKDYDCGDTQIELALTDVVCEGIGCSRKMAAAFWLPHGGKRAFRNNCAVVQWARGEMTIDGIWVTCNGPGCIGGRYCDENQCGFCPSGGYCTTISTFDWHIDQYRNDDAEYPIFDSPTTFDGRDWEAEGLKVPDNVPDNAVYIHDLPKVEADEPGQVVEADMELVIAVYNREDLEKLPARGGSFGSPYESPLPCVTKEWDFKAGPYTAH